MSFDEIQILDAAVDVDARDGIANLTLEAVAAQAGISKGGLLHYFPSKDRLIASMVSRCAEEWRTIVDTNYEQTAPGPGRLARSIIGHGLGDAPRWTEELRPRSAAVFAALAQNPSLIAPLRVVCAEIQNRIAVDGLPKHVNDSDTTRIQVGGFHGSGAVVL